MEADQANHQQAVADYDVGIASARAQVEAAKADVRDAELNLGYCRMYARRWTGRIGEAKVKVGNLVGTRQSAGGSDVRAPWPPSSSSTRWGSTSSSAPATSNAPPS